MIPRTSPTNGQKWNFGDGIDFSRQFDNVQWAAGAEATRLPTVFLRLKFC